MQEGKIKAYGVSNETTFGVCEWARAAKALDMPLPASIQNACSLVVRLFESELAEACATSNLNVGLLAYSILAGGLLSGKYRGGKEPAESRHAKYPNFMSRWNPSQGIPELLEAVEQYAAIAEELGMSLTDFSTRWCRTRSYCKHGSATYLTCAYLSRLTFESILLVIVCTSSTIEYISDADTHKLTIHMRFLLKVEDLVGYLYMGTS